MSWKKGN